MNIVLEIQYIAKATMTKVSQRGSFPVKGNKPEITAFKWWRQIKKEMMVDIEIQKVLANGQDITFLVQEFEKNNLYFQ